MATKKLNVEDALDGIGEWTLLELSDFIKRFEEKFDVQAAAMAAPVAMAGAGGGGEAAEAEEQTEFDVVLAAVGGEKLKVIKEVRSMTSLGLKEAKDLVEAAPKPVLERVPKEQAEEAKTKLEDVGATVELK